MPAESQKQIEVKEVRLRPKTGEHDIQVVLTKIRKFAGEGDKVKVQHSLSGAGRFITRKLPEIYSNGWSKRWPMWLG